MLLAPRLRPRADGGIGPPCWCSSPLHLPPPAHHQRQAERCDSRGILRVLEGARLPHRQRRPGRQDYCRRLRRRVGRGRSSPQLVHFRRLVRGGQRRGRRVLEDGHGCRGQPQDPGLAASHPHQWPCRWPLRLEWLSHTNLPSSLALLPPTTSSVPTCRPSSSTSSASAFTPSSPCSTRTSTMRTRWPPRRSPTSLLSPRPSSRLRTCPRVLRASLRLCVVRVLAATTRLMTTTCK